MATAGELEELQGAQAGFVGPLPTKLPVLADETLRVGRYATGANKDDYHIVNVTPGEDFQAEFFDLRQVVEGDAEVETGAPLEIKKSVEIGHIFKLGYKYSHSMGLNVLDQNGVETPVIMGSYGIGIERIMACAIETHYGEKGMVWPREIAPFLVELLPLNITHEPSRVLATNLYDKLRDAGITVLRDDRDERAGVKFNDAELYGAPVFVIIGERGLKEGIAELRIRDKGIEEKVPVENLGERIMAEFGK